MRLKRHCLLSIATFVCALLMCGLLEVQADEGDQEIVNLVIEELASGDAERQAGAIALARDIPGSALTQALAAELPKLSPPLQVQLLSTLGDRGDATVLPAVVAAGGHADESVRVAALKAVGQLGDASNVLLLARRAAETKGAEQAAARASLYRLRGPETDATVMNEIASASANAKVELIRAVGERNIAQGAQTLLAAAEDENRRVRIESLRMLRVVAEPKDIPSLLRFLLSLTNRAEQTEAEITVAGVVHKIEDPNRQAQTVLSAALATVKDATNQPSVLRVLGRIGDNGGLPTLRAALRSQDADVRDAAIRALADWPTPEPSDDLLKIAQTADSQVHRILALRGFVRLLARRGDLPAPQAVELYQQAMDLAPNAVEKKRVLSGLSGATSLAALEMAAGYVSDPALRLEAESAVVQIAGRLGEGHPQQALGRLEGIVKTTANDTIRDQAQEAIDRMKGLGSTQPSEDAAQ
ncbi:MAG: HEAT repeat domain-containing protein [Sedimentisphaerales bacterium]|nr:HEAT repeat domain-containing protein [Sedimentisphaerales bacterium]